MPKRKDIDKVLIIGSGPIIILITIHKYFLTHIDSQIPEMLQKFYKYFLHNLLPLTRIPHTATQYYAY